MNRRGFLGAAAGSLVAGPALARQAATEIASGQLPVGMQLRQGYGLADAMAAPRSSTDIARKAFMTPGVRDEIRSLIFEREKAVTFIDHDIASKRSFSLAAKITFQRQRNVERELASMTSDHPWSRVHELLMKFAGPF